MKESTQEKIIISEKDNLKANLSLQKITVLWAFSESAFGGFLHALKIPFRGIFISSAAVVFITLIAFASKQSKEILKSTLIVLLIKALVSPHSPLTAYFAMSLQGVLGYILFVTKKYFRLSAFFLGVSTLLFSGAQKIVILTILFGNTLWRSINVFISQVSNLFFNLGENININFGYMFVGIYLLIHLIAGIFIGFYAGKLPQKINLNFKKVTEINFEKIEPVFSRNNQKKNRYWYQRPTGIIILFISVSLLIFSYLSPTGIGINNSEIILMLLRSVILTFIWFIIISPILRKLFQKFLLSKKSGYAEEIDKIINEFPRFRKLISYCWSNSSAYPGLKRIYYFFTTSFYLLFIIDNEF